MLVSDFILIANGASAKTRFMAYVQKTRTCWLWTGHTNGKAGYGMFAIEGSEKIPAPRASYILFKGPIPGRQVVRHACDNPLCVNPAHLTLGSHVRNAKDMLERGRGRYMSHPGETNGFSKLTWREVREMRARWAKGPKTRHLQEVLADKYDISVSNVYMIVSGRTWKEDAKPGKVEKSKARKKRR